MTCQEAMTKAPVTCTPDDSVQEAARQMRHHDIGSLPVVRSGQDRVLVGVVTDRDLALRVVAEGADPHGTRIGQVMSTDVVFCRAEDGYQQALQLMADRQLRRMPVVDGTQHVVGIIAQADVATRLAQPNTTGMLVDAISEPHPVHGERGTRE